MEGVVAIFVIWYVGTAIIVVTTLAFIPFYIIYSIIHLLTIWYKQRRKIG
jgi:hypothetical protein